MAIPRVFFVHLRRPKSASKCPNERRDDPFYEFGSFGCTGCHSDHLFNPRHAAELEGARLAFIQGGPLGSRLVFLTPPIIKVTKWRDCCEARWTPAEMPFKYTKAPVLAHNDGRSNFPLVEAFARDADRTTIEGALSSRFRNRTKPLPETMAKEVIEVYERLRAEASPSDIATTYDEALPSSPPMIDRTRQATYRSHISQLADNTEGAERVLQSVVATPETQPQSGCSLSQRRQSEGRTRRCS